MGHPTVYRGFALIEAIVALVVFTMTMLAVYAWINTNLTTLVKSGNVITEEAVLDKALVQLQQENFSKIDTGRYQFDNYLVEWRATLIEPIKKGKNARGGTGLYDFGLYEVELAVFIDHRLLSDYRLRLINHWQVRQLEFET